MPKKKIKRKKVKSNKDFEQNAKVVVSPLTSVPATNNNVQTDTNRFADLLPIPLNTGNDIATTAKVLVERGEDERLKSEIYNPVELSILKTVSSLLKSKGLLKSAIIIDTLIEQYTSFMFSYKRGSRNEYIQTVQAAALKALADRQDDLAKKLLASDEVKK